MKVIAVIPARYNSSRFPGKPLADINGKPMIYWVYQQVKKVTKFVKVIIATDDKRIYDECQKYDMLVEMTKENHNTSTERVYEVALRNNADYYVVINGDEPLIEPKVIEKIIPSKKEINKPFVSNVITKIKSPVEAIDFTNIKVVKDNNDNAMYFSRSPIPYPKNSMEFDYYKHVGILCYDIEALEKFSNLKKGPVEKIEDVNEIRFLENNIKVKLINCQADTLSVDTPKDLEKILKIMEEKNKNIGEENGRE